MGRNWHTCCQNKGIATGLPPGLEAHPPLASAVFSRWRAPFVYMLVFVYCFISRGGERRVKEV